MLNRFSSSVFHKPSRKLKVATQSQDYYITWLEKPVEAFYQAASVSSGRVILITDDRLYKIYEDQILQQFTKEYILTIPDGEEQKNLDTIALLTNRLIELGADRSSVLVAFGGGVVGDITGFLASVYMRGIEYCQIPTTLLAMVDSSVGGKTGVNISSGKNMIGTFHQPTKVLICVSFLKSLLQREVVCGLAEVVKSALIKNNSFFEKILENASDILEKDLALLEFISYESIKIKRWVVQKDEKEKSFRAILNLGHTLAHALENFFGYRIIKHGEAVSVGLAFAAYYSFRKSKIKEKDFQKIMQALQKLHLPQNLDSLFLMEGADVLDRPNPEKLTAIMKKDKKNKQGVIRFVFLESIGKTSLPEEVTENEVCEILTEFFSLA